MKLSRLIATPVLAGTMLALTPAVAQADAVDRALAAIPAGQISCEQARKHWTNDADYNNKVRQARALAVVDSRGPRILEALGRVDEAANRCGLKGGGAAPAPAPARPAQQAPARPAPAPAPAQGRPAPAPAPAAAPAQTIALIPGAPVAQVVSVPGSAQAIAIPDLLQMVRTWLAGFGIRI